MRSRDAVTAPGIDPGEVDDIVMGCALQQGSTGNNIARQAALRAGMPVTRRRHDASTASARPA